MRVYLIRHGEATPEKADNTDYPLSEKGKEDIRHIATFLAKQPLEIKHIFHSGILRAKETAEMIAKKINFNGEIEVYTEMQPYDSISTLASMVNQASEDIIIVGHMPFLGLLLSKLVTGDEHQDVLYLHKGTTVCLERIEHSTTWLIEWCITPEVVA